MKRAYFLSDTHLGASYMPDSRQAERRLVAFLDSIKDDASEIYLLGDILDYWYEYRYVVPRGYVRFFGKLAELSDSGIKITWIIGNHDIWIFDYLPFELGIEVVDGVLDCEVLGSRMVMAHGDGIRQDSRRFRFLRSLFRNKYCQRMYSAIHPRWTVPFAYAWSRHSRDTSADIVPSVTKNLESLRHFCHDYLTEAPDCRYFLFGHLHRLVRERIADRSEMIILGEWLNLMSYAVFDGKEMQVLRYNSQM